MQLLSVTFSEINDFPAFFKNVETNEFIRVNADRSARAIKIVDHPESSIARTQHLKPLAPLGIVDALLRFAIPVEREEYELAESKLKTFMQP